MSFSEEDEEWIAKVDEEVSKGKARNPWAVCTATVGREDKDKYERCVQHVKKSMGKSEAEEETVGLHDFPTLESGLRGQICKTCQKASLLQSHTCSRPETCLCPACLVDAGIDPDVVANVLFASAAVPVPSPTVAPQAPLYEDEAGKAGRHKGGGEHMAYDACIQKMSHRKGVRDPEALCAYIGRKSGHHKMEEEAKDAEELGKRLTEEERAIAEEELAGGVHECVVCEKEFPSAAELNNHLDWAHGVKPEEEAYEEVEEDASQFYEAATDLLVTLQAGLVSRVATFTASMDNFYPFTPTSPTPPPLTKNLDGTPAANPIDTPFNKMDSFFVEVGWFAKTLDQINSIVDNFEAYMDEFHFRDKADVEAYKEHNKKLGGDWLDFKDPAKSSKRYWMDTKKNLGK